MSSILSHAFTVAGYFRSFKKFVSSLWELVTHPWVWCLSFIFFFLTGLLTLKTWYLLFFLISLLFFKIGRKASSTKLSNCFNILVCQCSKAKVIVKSWSLTNQSSVLKPDVYQIFCKAPLSFTGQAVWNSSFVAIMEHLHLLFNFWFACLHFSYVWKSIKICSSFRIAHNEKLRYLRNNSFICAECLLGWAKLILTVSMC